MRLHHLLLTTGCLLASVASAARPNVLFIASDDMRPQLGCYGDKFAKTPNVDNLAGRGTLFKQAYCMQAVCAPSRNALLTGLRPQVLRIYDLSTNFRASVPEVMAGAFTSVWPSSLYLTFEW